MTVEKKAWDSLWDGIIGRRYKAHEAWYERGRAGPGRMVLSDENLQGARVVSLAGVQFTRCDLSGAALGRSFMGDAELIECNFFDAPMNYSMWDRARLERCSFVEAGLGGADFTAATAEGCTWQRTYLERSLWVGASVNASSFDDAVADNVVFDDATLTGCTFRRTLMRRTVQSPAGNVGTCFGTRFTDCDFRGADVTRLRLANTTFTRCKFHGLLGKPVLEGPVIIEGSDFSPDADGSDLRTREEVLAQWQPLP
jgi:uncharacterized protein YjbI with pentapeptide repeats